MNKITALIITLFVSLSATAQTSLDELDWLIGSWKRLDEKPGRLSTETWTMEDDKLVGMGATVFGTDTVFVEKLEIKKVNAEYFYVANTSDNAKPTEFKMTEFDEFRFVVENPQHDFPKKIEYALRGNSLIAAISNEAGREIYFQFEKMED